MVALPLVTPCLVMDRLLVIWAESYHHKSEDCFQFLEQIGGTCGGGQKQLILAWVY